MDEPRLYEALGEAQRLGFLGDRPLGVVVDHARNFVSALDGVEGTVIDLGSGGGVPGLVVAHDRPDLDLVLLDRRAKRTDFLERVVRRNRLGARVTVLTGDASNVWRRFPGGVAAVVARGFGPPEATLRAASRFLSPTGRVVVSEPPDQRDRWPVELLEELELRRLPSTTEVASFGR